VEELRRLAALSFSLLQLPTRGAASRKIWGGHLATCLATNGVLGSPARPSPAAAFGSTAG